MRLFGVSSYYLVTTFLSKAYATQTSCPLRTHENQCHVAIDVIYRELQQISGIARHVCVDMIMISSYLGHLSLIFPSNLDFPLLRQLILPLLHCYLLPAAIFSVKNLQDLVVLFHRFHLLRQSHTLGPVTDVHVISIRRHL